MYLLPSIIIFLSGVICGAGSVLLVNRAYIKKLRKTQSEFPEVAQIPSRLREISSKYDEYLVKSEEFNNKVSSMVEEKHAISEELKSLLVQQKELQKRLTAIFGILQMRNKDKFNN